MNADLSKAIRHANPPFCVVLVDRLSDGSFLFFAEGEKEDGVVYQNTAKLKSHSDAGSLIDMFFT